MKEYLITLFLVCLVSAIVKTASPEGAMKKYIDILCSVCVISAVILPISTEISSIDSISQVLFGDMDTESENYDEIYNNYLLEHSKENAKRVLEEELCGLFGKQNGAIGIHLGLQDDGVSVSVSSVKVILTPAAIDCAPRIIDEHLLERTGCKCEIIYDNINE